MITDFRVGGTNYFFIGYEGHEAGVWKVWKWKGRG